MINDRVNKLRLIGSRQEDGSNAGIINTAENPGTYDCLMFRGVHECFITGFEIRNGFSGIVLDSCWNSCITKNYIFGNQGAGTGRHSNGILLANSFGIEISYCIIDSNEFHGIDINSTRNLLILNNNILRTILFDGINIGQNINDIMISSNILAFNAEEGIEIVW